MTRGNQAGAIGVDSMVREVLRRFAKAIGDRAVGTIRRPEHAAVAFVWMLDDRLVLRARVDGPGTAAAFAAEAALVSRVRPLLPWLMPSLLPADDGATCVRAGGFLWTLYPALPGRVLCPWQDLDLLGEGPRRDLVAALRAMHDATRGRLGEGGPAAFLGDLADRIRLLAPGLPAKVNDRLEAAMERTASRPVAEADLVFVHGDFHYGNLLLDDCGRVAGLLDLDWCRVGHPAEDLAYLAMMLVRDYRGGPPRVADQDRVASWYGLPDADRDAFEDLVVLYAAFDAHLFEHAASLERRDFYLAYQRDLLARLCAA